MQLGAANTFSGNTSIVGGTLKLSNTNALQNSTLNYSAGMLAFDNSVASHAFTLGGLSGTNASITLALKDAANNPVALTVGNNGQSTAFTGAISDNGATPRTGSLIKIGSGTLTLTGPLSYAGNTDIQGGMLQLAESGAVTLTTITGAAGTLAVRGSTSLTATSIGVDSLTIGGAVTAAASATAPVPEPGTWILLLFAVVGLGAGRSLRRK